MNGACSHIAIFIRKVSQGKELSGSSFPHSLESSSLKNRISAAWFFVKGCLDFSIHNSSFRGWIYNEKIIQVEIWYCWNIPYCSRTGHRVLVYMETQCKLARVYNNGTSSSRKAGVCCLQCCLGNLLAAAVAHSEFSPCL